ncbi:hypothetical protein ACWDYF_11805 [Streptomyces sp. NPDC003284]
MRAHQHAAAARKRGAGAAGQGDRPCGGPATKTHLACDDWGRPLVFTVTAGNVNDCTRFKQVRPASAAAGAGPAGPGHRGQGPLVTKNRTHLRRRGTKAAIPEQTDHVNGRIPRGESLCRPAHPGCRCSCALSRRSRRG